ncbi:MAG: ATP-dependent DNA ligase [Microbacterium sp.]
MGRFIYEGDVRAEFEDRLLAHIQVVIGNKLRRDEPFFFSWKEDASLGTNRMSIWVHPHATLVFKFHGSRPPAINPAWLDALMHTANSPTGLFAVPEPA